MKKNLSLVLAAVLMAGILAGCGGGAKDSGSAPDSGANSPAPLTINFPTANSTGVLQPGLRRRH